MDFSPGLGDFTSHQVRSFYLSLGKKSRRNYLSFFVSLSFPLLKSRAIHIHRPCPCHLQQHQEVLLPKMKLMEDLRSHRIIHIHQSLQKSQLWVRLRRFYRVIIKIRHHQRHLIQTLLRLHLEAPKSTIFNQAYSKILKNIDSTFRWITVHTVIRK